jgi:hypothetical protein
MIYAVAKTLPPGSIETDTLPKCRIILEWLLARESQWDPLEMTLNRLDKTVEASTQLT